MVPFPVLGWNYFKFQPKKEMELLTCGQIFCHLCQFITDLCRCRTYLLFLTTMCLFVACLFEVFDMKYLSLPLNILEYSRYSKREIFPIENWEQHPDTQKYVLSCCATKNLPTCEQETLSPKLWKKLSLWSNRELARSPPTTSEAMKLCVVLYSSGNSCMNCGLCCHLIWTIKLETFCSFIFWFTIFLGHP